MIMAAPALVATNASEEPSFFDKVGDVFRGIRTGGISLDSGTRPVQGAVVPEVAPVANAVATPSVTVTSELPNSVDKANAALQTASSPRDYLDIAHQVRDDPGAVQGALLRYQNAVKGQQVANETIDKVASAGGMTTPTGRLEYAKLWQNADNAPQYGNAFIQYALGNVNAAKKLLSGGAINEKSQIDTDTGHLIKYGVDQNGDYHWARNETTGQQLSPDDFSKVVGKLGTLEQSKKYIVEKENSTAWAKQANEDYKTAGTVAAAAPGMKVGYEQLKLLSNDLKNSGLDPASMALLTKFTNNTLGLSQSRRGALERLKQTMSSGGVKEGDDVSAAIAAALGIPGAKFNADGKTVSSNGKTFSIQELENNTTTSGVNSEIEKNFSQSQADFAKNAVMSGLAQKDPTGQLQLKFTQALELAKSLAQKEAALPTMPYAIPTVGFGVTDEFARARIQAEQGIVTQKFHQAYAAYVKSISENSSSPPKPGDLQAGFAATDTYKSLLNDYKKEADSILREPREFLPTTASPAAGSSASAEVAAPIAAPLINQFPANKDAQKQPAGSAKPTEKSAEAKAAELEAKKAAARKEAKEAAAAAAKK
jgi:hypothetical protein